MDHEEIPNYGNRYVILYKRGAKDETRLGACELFPLRLILERARYLNSTASSFVLYLHIMDLGEHIISVLDCIEHVEDLVTPSCN